MNRTAWVLLVLVVAAPSGLQAEVGLGLSIGYVLPLIGELGGGPEAILAGVNVRWKPSIIFFDAGLSHLLDGGVSFGFLDLGLCFDWRFLRFGLAAGLDRVGSEEEGGPDSEDGLNVKANLDFLLGRASIGLSGSFPLAMELTDQDLQRLASQLSLNLFYWFGTRSRRR